MKKNKFFIKILKLQTTRKFKKTKRVLKRAKQDISRITAGIALVFLISCPVLLILKKENTAKRMAIYAYLFLVITTVLRIVEYKKHPKVHKKRVLLKPRL